MSLILSCNRLTNIFEEEKEVTIQSHSFSSVVSLRGNCSVVVALSTSQVVTVGGGGGGDGISHIALWKSMSSEADQV